MNKLAIILSILLVALVVLEDSAEANTSSRRRRRKQRECEQISMQLPAPKIDCLEIPRQEYINRYLNGDNFDICHEARYANQEEIPEIAKRHKEEKSIVQKCFGEDFSKVNEIESSFIKLTKENQKEHRMHLLKVFAISALSIFLLFGSFLLYLNVRKD